MPNAYVQKVAEEHGIALQKLEEYWAKAKELAKKNKDVAGQEYWSYVMGIFKNMASLNSVSVSAAFESISKKVAQAIKVSKKVTAPVKSTKTIKKIKPVKPVKPVKPLKIARTVKVTKKSKPPVKKVPAHKGAAVKLPEWWVKLSEKSKATYVERHPASKFVRQVAAKNPALKKVLVKAQKAQGIKTEERSSDDLPKAALDKEPKTVPKISDNSKPEVMPAGGPSKQAAKDKAEQEQAFEQKKHKSIFHRAYFKARQKINHTLTRDKLGRHCVGKFLTGHVLSDNEHKHMMNWVGTAAKLVVGVAVMSAMFTPLAGMAPELGKHFLTLLTGKEGGSFESSESSDSADKLVDTKGQIVPIGNPEHFEATDFTDRLHQWLMTQDITKLAEDLKKEQQ